MWYYCHKATKQGEVKTTSQNYLMERKKTILKALSHPVRLKIAEGLRDGERGACEICDDFPMDRTTISKHLSVLKDAGVVSARKDGINVFYSLKLSCYGRLMRCIEGSIRQELLDGLETLRGQDSSLQQPVDF